jgi:hypothetical protein
MRRNILSCIIHKPFKVSEYVSNPKEKTQMKAFLDRYQHEYKVYVREAIKLAEEPRLKN